MKSKYLSVCSVYILLFLIQIFIGFPAYSSDTELTVYDLGENYGIDPDKGGDFGVVLIDTLKLLRIDDKKFAELKKDSFGMEGRSLGDYELYKVAAGPHKFTVQYLQSTINNDNGKKKIKTLYSQNAKEVQLTVESGKYYTFSGIPMEPFGTSFEEKRPPVIIIPNGPYKIEFGQDPQSGCDYIQAQYFVYALKAGDLEKAEEFLKNDPRMLTVKLNEHNNISIHYAVKAEKNRKEIVDLLIKRGVDPNSSAVTAFWIKGNTLFHETAAKIDELTLPVLDLLLSNKVPVNAKNENGRTPLQYVCGKTPSESVTSAVKWFLDHGASVSEKDKDGDAPINMAAGAGNAEVVKLLIEKKADVNNAGGLNKDTPLHSAAAKGSIETAQLLLDNKAQVNVKNDGGKTPVDLAMEKDHKDMIKLLLDHGAVADINTACESGNAELAGLILAGKPELAKTKSTDGYPLIFTAVRKKNLEFVRTLIKMGADVNAKSENQYSLGRTPLYQAVDDGNLEMVQELVNAGADVNAASGDNTPLTQAAFDGHESIVQLLLERKASPNQKDKYGSSPLHYALMDYNKDENKKYNILKSLLENGADVNIRNSKGETPLHLALINASGNTDIVQLLLDNKADMNIKDNEGETPFQFAKDHSSDAIFRLILKYKK